MFVLKTVANRPAIVCAIVATLLLPVLHFHRDYSHGHGHHETHDHGVIHADFFATFAQDHGEESSEHKVWDESPTGVPDQISLVTLASRNLWSFAEDFQNKVFLIFIEPVTPPESPPYRWTLEREHSPPIAAFYRNPNSPRSPPQSV